jgi:seryl-tRNA synthetase
MPLVGRLVVEITGDSKKLDESLDKTKKKTKKTKKEIDKFSKSLDKLSKDLSKKIKIGAAVAATAIVALGAKAINAASAFEETQSKFLTVFKDIQDEATATAENLEKNFGLSSRAALQLLGDVGDILTGFGFTQEEALNLSKQVNELAVDLASFTNFAGGASGASAALTKALLGEAESVKALGIVIRQDTEEYKELIKSIQETQQLGS